MTPSDDDLRSALLAAAERQLVAASDGEIATRAVCEAVGVTQPVLYRVFGDKQGLLDALAETGLQRYAARKSELEATDDPAADLRRGWGDHLDFARENPALYRLMFAPRPWAGGRSADGVRVLLERTLSRCAAAGLLRLEVDVASGMILAANVGLALDEMTAPRPARQADAVADALRDAVLGAVLVAESPTASFDAATAARRQLRAQLAEGGPGALLPEESALMNVWLTRLDQESDGLR